MKTMPVSPNNSDPDSKGDSDGDRVSLFSPKRLIPLSPIARRTRDLKETRIGWKMAALGWEFSSQVVAGVALGWGVDYLYPNLGHWGIIGGASAGVLVAVSAFIRNALKLNNELEGTDKKHQNGAKNG
jgi:F0F1-type ATP synthase assembly protein I